MSTRENLKLLAAALAAAVLVPASATAQDCVDYSKYLRWVHCEGDDARVGITMVGTLSYQSVGGRGLVIYDVSNPNAPVELGVADTPGVCLGNIVVGDLAYVADGNYPGFCVVDVSDPYAPTVLGSAGPGSGYLYDLAMVAPDTVWVADGYYGIRIFDVTDPAAPRMIGSFSSGNSPWSLEVHDGDVYVPDSYGLRIYGISEGASEPHVLGSVAAADFNYGFARVDNVFYVLGYEGTTLIDVTDPTAPVVVGYYDTLGNGLRMEITGHLGVAAEGGNNQFYLPGLEILDLTDPLVPSQVSFMATQQQCYDVQIAGKFAFVTTEQRGMLVANLANPAEAPFAGSLGLPDATQVAAAGDYAYVAGGTFGLLVVDISVPAYTTTVGVYDPVGGVTDVVLQGDYAYSASGSPGLEIVDISDPTDPALVGSVDPFGSSVAVAVSGNWAYLAAGTWGVQVIDISDPAVPVQRATLSITGTPYGLTVAGSHLYIACNGRLHVADISNPLAPVLVGLLPLPGTGDDVTVADGLAFISGREDGLHIVDIANPTAPVMVSTLRTPGEVCDAAVDGDVVYIADYAGGLEIADISDPAAPRLVGTRDTPNHTALGVALAGDRVCIADWVGGFHVAWRQCDAVAAQPDLPAPTAASLQAYPNPFNPRTTFVFTLPGAPAATLRVYDVAGRLVRTLLENGDVGTTQATVDWDGRDDAGRTVAAGIYIGRLESGGHTATTAVVLVK